MAMGYRLLIAALLGFGTSPSAVRADPVTIRSGSFIVAWDDPSSFDIAGDGLVLSGLFVRIPSSPQQTCFNGCLSGTTVNLSAVAGGPFDRSLGESPIAVLNGVSLTVPNQPETISFSRRATSSCRRSRRPAQGRCCRLRRSLSWGGSARSGEVIPLR